MISQISPEEKKDYIKDNPLPNIKGQQIFDDDTQDTILEEETIK